MINIRNKWRYWRCGKHMWKY